LKNALFVHHLNAKIVRAFLLTLILLACVFPGRANVIFVKQGADGAGTSWTDALGNLSDALNMAQSGDEIWVAEGVYAPTATTDRTISFHIKDGIKLYGGFAGTESGLEFRNFTAHPTVLSGEIGAPGIDDNSYTIVITSGVSENTVIDGFIITGGNANGDTEEGHAYRSGGAWYNDARGGTSNPTINNCVFVQNHGREGGAFYNMGLGGQAGPTLTNCVFRENESSMDGGAVYNNSGGEGACNPAFILCVFERNAGIYGAAVFNTTGNGHCDNYFDTCSFIENKADMRGGAIYDINGQFACYSELLDCTFENNYPDDRNFYTANKMSLSEAYSIEKP